MNRPVIYLAFANDRDRYLRMVNRERKQISRALRKHDDAGSIQLLTEASMTVEDIFHDFHEYDQQVAIFHYGGHAGSDHLQLETEQGETLQAQTSGLGALLGMQESLKLVFLNGCATKDQVRILLNNGVKAVIATSVKVDDQMASEFAEHFYLALSNQLSIKNAFNRATAFILSKYNNREIKNYQGTHLTKWLADPVEELPWGLYTRDESNEVLDWSLPAPTSGSLKVPRKNRLLNYILLIGAILAVPATIMEIAGFSLRDIFMSSAETTTGSVTVFVHGRKSKSDKVLRDQCSVRMIYGDADKIEAIDAEGEVVFTGIPKKFFGSDAHVRFEITNTQNELYQPTRPDSLYSLTAGEGVYLEIEIVGLDEIFGLVTNAQTSLPVDSVRISIVDLAVYTDAFGVFRLSIPFDRQAKFHSVRAQKKGYHLWERANIPAQIDVPIAISLKPQE